MMNIIYLGVDIFCIVLYFEGVRKKREEKNDALFLEQFACFLQKVQYFYSMNPLIEEAVYEAMNETKGELFQEVQEIYEVLEVQQEERRRNYMKQQSNRFLKLFMAILSIESQWGMGKKFHTFQNNLQFLKQEVTLERWKQQQIKSLFSGLQLLVLVPAFFLITIERWGISNIPELVQYYHGSYGLDCVALFTLLIYATDWTIWQLRNSKDEYQRSYKKLEWLENRESIKTMLDYVEQKYYSRYLKRKKRLKEAGATISPRQFLLKQMLYIIGSSLFVLFFRLHCLVALFLVWISLEIPWWEVLYEQQMRKRGIQNELLYYETIFCMFIENEGMKEMELIERLEEGSVLFQDSIAKCLLCLYGGEQKALQQLKEEEVEKDFQKLVDTLIMSDQVGFRIAFTGIEQDRQNRQEKKKQEQEIEIKKKAAIGKIVAFLPMSIIIGVYLIVPFVLESIVQLSAFMTQMNQL